MADPDAGPDAATAALEARVQQLDQDMYEQARWVESSLFDPLLQMRQMADTLTVLSRRMDNLERYLGMQDGAQPLVLYDGIAHHTYYEDEAGRWREWGRTLGIEAEDTQEAQGVVGSDADHSGTHS